MSANAIGRVPNISTNLDELEGRQVFERAGLVCLGGLNHVRLIDIDPNGSYSGTEQLELDYLIPYGSVCFVGEMKGGTNTSSIKEGYDTHTDRLNFLRPFIRSEQMWRRLGVPSDKLHLFSDIRELRGIFIMKNVERLDLLLPEDAHVIRFYEADYQRLKEYGEVLGTFAQPYLLNHLGVSEPRDTSFTIDRAQNNLIVTYRRKVASGGVGLADVFTFDRSPYDLLPIAQVYRRDDLPSLSPTIEDYQRALIKKKLETIRDILRVDEEFIFPNSILVVLSNDCIYDAQTDMLMIPGRYGAVTVIDGQHRLFAYADEQIRTLLSGRGSIMVTAIRFREANEEQVQKYSARTFIEINTNQTPISKPHLDAIAYDILGDEKAKSIATKVILEANEKAGRLRGYLITSQTRHGRIPTATVISELKKITNLENIRRLPDATRRNQTRMRDGYARILLVNQVSDLTEAGTLVDTTTSCLGWYFNQVAEVFRYDWPQGNRRLGDSEPTPVIMFAKMVAAFIRLLWQFLAEGCNRDNVRVELEKIRDNMLLLRGLTSYRAPLFDLSAPEVPDARPPVASSYRFLNKNRIAPTNIHDA